MISAKDTETTEKQLVHLGQDRRWSLLCNQLFDLTLTSTGCLVLLLQISVSCNTFREK